MKLQNRGLIQLLFVNLIWGGSYAFAKIALNEIGPLYLIALSYIIGSIILSLIFYKHLKGISKSSLICGTITGLFVTCGTILTNVGLQYTTSVKAGLLNSMELITIPLILWIVFKDKFSLNDFVSVFLAVCGIVLINYNGVSFSFNIGDLLCAVGPMFFAAQIVILSRYSKSDEVQITVIELLIVGITTTVIAFIFEDVPLDISNKSLYAVAYLGALSCGIAYYLETFALKSIKPTYAGLINTIMPVFTMIISYILLGEVLGFVSMLGSVFIILALFNFNMKIIDKFINKDIDNSLNI